MTHLEDELPPGSGSSGIPLLDEAARLAQVVQDWARTNLPPPEPGGDGPAECRWCPLCQFAAVLRGERPDVNDKLAEVGNAVVGMLRTLLDPATGGHRHGPEPGGPRVQRIDLGGPDLGGPDQLDPGAEPGSS